MSGIKVLLFYYYSILPSRTFLPYNWASWRTVLFLDTSEGWSMNFCSSVLLSPMDANGKDLSLFIASPPCLPVFQPALLFYFGLVRILARNTSWRSFICFWKNFRVVIALCSLQIQETVKFIVPALSLLPFFSSSPSFMFLKSHCFSSLSLSNASHSYSDVSPGAALRVLQHPPCLLYGKLSRLHQFLSSLQKQLELLF